MARQIGKQEEANQDVKVLLKDNITSIYGIYFCNLCNNIINPVKANGLILQFMCQLCGIIPIDFDNRNNEQCLLYCKQIQDEDRNINIDERLIFDKTLMTVQVRCPECNYHQAAYLSTSDHQEDRIITKMICLNTNGSVIKCGNIWQLQPKLQIYENQVLTKEQGAKKEEERTIKKEKKEKKKKA